MINCQSWDLRNFSCIQLFKDFFSDFVTGFKINQAGFHVDDIFGGKATENFFWWCDVIGDAFLFKLTQYPRCQLGTGFNSNSARFCIEQIIIEFQATQGFGIKGNLPAFFSPNIIDGIVKEFKDFFRRHTFSVKRIKRFAFGRQSFTFGISCRIIKSQQHGGCW